MRPATANYKERIDDDEFECVMEVEEFVGCVEMGGFIDDDGFGYPVKNNLADTSERIYPSDWSETIPLDATHIWWFNR